jgi:hypothetical protein
MTAWIFALWMLPFAALAGFAVFIGYLAWDAARAKERAALAATAGGPDPVLELERINTELARAATTARLTLEAAREAVRKGTR